MVEPVIGKAAEQGVKSFGAVVDKLLGPTAELMGQDLVNWYARKRNAKRVVERAAVRADLALDGSVPVRLAADVLEKAQWADNEFVAEYLSGVLASGRTTGGVSDSAISWSALVGRLSADQLALHWVLYSSFQKRARGENSEGFWPLVSRQVVVDYPTVFTALTWQLSSDEDLHRLMEAAYGLRREGLLVDMSHGGGDFLEDEVTWTKGRALRRDLGYLTFKVTADGIGLLLHAVGLGGLWFGSITSEAVALALQETRGLPDAPVAVFVEDVPVR